MSPRDVTETSALWLAVSTAALVSAYRGAFDRAVRLLAAADARSEWAGRAFPFGSAAQQGITARARHQMGDSAYDTAVAEGHALSAEDAVNLARAALKPRTPMRPRTAATGTAESPSVLSDREQAVLRLIAEGLPNKQIATALAIADRTVRAHLTSAMNKLGVDNRAHAAVVAIQRGLL